MIKPDPNPIRFRDATDMWVSQPPCITKVLIENNVVLKMMSDQAVLIVCCLRVGKSAASVIRRKQVVNRVRGSGSRGMPFIATHTKLGL